MKPKELKELIRSSDDKAIRVCLADGASYRIHHPDFAFTTLESLILASGPGHDFGAEFIVVPLDHISRVEVLRRRGKGVSPKY